MVPRASRAVRAGPLAAQQAGPRNPWEGTRGRAGEGRWGCAGHKHVQSAGCRAAGEHSPGEGVSNWSVGGV